MALNPKIAIALLKKETIAIPNPNPPVVEEPIQVPPTNTPPSPLALDTSFSFRPIDRTVMHVSEWFKCANPMAQGKWSWMHVSDCGMYFHFEMNKHMVIVSYGHHSNPLEDKSFLKKKEFMSEYDRIMNKRRDEKVAEKKPDDAVTKARAEEVI